MSNIELRPIKRDGFCRSCDLELDVGTEIVYTRGIRDVVILCIDCAKEIAKLVKDK
jgi:hypothetical protein